MTQSIQTITSVSASLYYENIYVSPHSSSREYIMVLVTRRLERVQYRLIINLSFNAVWSPICNIRVMHVNVDILKSQ